MKVLLVDPWGINNTSEYLNGLIYGLSSLTDLTIATNHFFELKTDSKCNICRIFFKKSEKMKKGLVRKILRGVEYFLAKFKLLKLIKNNNFDIVHFNWLLDYKIDFSTIKRIKKISKCKIVYTAHNVIPHIKGKNHIKNLQNIYNAVDRIVVHGESIKKELVSTFPGFENKIYVQKHGCNLPKQIKTSNSRISSDVLTKINSFEKVFIFFGAIFYNKGVDRVIDFWLKENPNALLIVAGRQNNKYDAFEKQKDAIKYKQNILLFDYFVDDVTLNYLIEKSQLILLPYRHASMSGVVFTACDFSKPILYTDVGSLSEYLDASCSFKAENNRESLLKMLKRLTDSTYSNNDLIKMGKRLTSLITKECSWKTICNGLFVNVYLGS